MIINGARIRKLRKEQDISVDELAFRIGVSSNVLRQIELGSKTPSAIKLKLIADYLSVTTDSLYIDLNQDAETKNSPKGA